MKLYWINTWKWR